MNEITIKKWDYLKVKTDYENGQSRTETIRVDRVDEALDKDRIEVHYSDLREEGHSPVVGDWILPGELIVGDSVKISDTHQFTYPIKHTIQISLTEKPEGKKFGYDH